MFHVELLEYLPLTMVVFTNVLLRGRQIKQRLHVAVYARGQHTDVVRSLLQAHSIRHTSSKWRSYSMTRHYCVIVI